MNIFKLVQTYYLALGIGPSNHLIRELPFNRKILSGFLLFGSVLASQCVYMYRVANVFTEYVNCICSMSASIIVIVCFASVAFQKTLLFEMIKNIEKLIDASENVE